MSEQPEHPQAPVVDDEIAVTEDTEGAPEGELKEEPEPEPERPAGFRLRRAPRYRPFGVTGAVLGAAAGIVLALSFTATSDYTIRTIAGYFAAIFGLVGAVLGLGLAVLLERRRRS